jgi:hypothetical protein
MRLSTIRNSRPYVQRPGGGKKQAFLHATLDDASRLIPHAQFYPSQGVHGELANWLEYGGL